jgi:hypothetical protein
LGGGVVNANIGAPGSFAEANSPDAGGLSGNLDRRPLRDIMYRKSACPLRSVDRDFLPPFNLRARCSATSPDTRPSASTNPRPSASTVLCLRPRPSLDTRPSASTNTPSASTDPRPSASTNTRPSASTDSRPSASTDSRPSASTDSRLGLDQPSAFGLDRLSAFGLDRPRPSASTASASWAGRRLRRHGGASSITRAAARVRGFAM